MPRGNGKTETVDPKAKRKALAEVKRTSKAVKANDSKGEELRKKRNEAIVKAAKYAAATEIADEAEIKQSYVSRVIRSGGKPSSGSALDRNGDA